MASVIGRLPLTVPARGTSRRRLISQHLRRLLVQLFVLLLGDEVDQALHDRVWLHPFGLGIEVGDYTVAQDWDRDLAYVFGANVIPTLQERAGFAGEDEILAGARAGAP